MSSLPSAPSRPRKEIFKRRFPWGWVVLLGLGAAALGASYYKRQAPVSLAATSPALLKAGSRNPLVSASGYLVARHRATLSSKVLGRVAWLGVEEGSRVTKGQVLARLESSDLEAAKQQTTIQLEQARRDLTRAEALFKQTVLDQATLDKLRSQVEALQAQIKYQDALLENMVLRAPFSGTITQKLSEVGETVAPGSAGGANAINALLVLADFESLEVEVEVNESGLPLLKKQMPVEIRVDALENDTEAQVLKGVLREIYPTSNRQKAVVTVRVAFQERHPLLLPDMGAKVTFLGEPIPKDTFVLGREQIVQGNKVWILDQDKAQLKTIQIKSENPLGFEAEGLKGDEKLLQIPADFKLEVGKRVKVKP